MDQEQIPLIFGKRVFVAGDNEIELTQITELLKQDRHEVAIGRSGLQALEILSARDFDIMFLDVSLKNMDAPNLLRIYRFGKFGSASAFFLSADGTAETPAKLRAAGAVGLLHKPVTSQTELRRAIAKVCATDSTIRLTRVSAQTQTRAPEKAKVLVLKIVPPQFIDPWVIESLKSVSGAPGVLPKLLVIAAEEIGRISNDIIQALACRDFNRIGDSAHALKGVAATVGAIRLVPLARKLIDVTEHQQGSTMKRVVGDIAEASDKSITALLDIAFGLGNHGSLAKR